MHRLQMHIKQKQNENKPKQDEISLSFPREYLTPITEEKEAAFNTKRHPSDPVILSEDRLSQILRNGLEAGYAFADKNGIPYLDSNGTPKLMWTMFHNIKEKYKKKPDRSQELQRQEELRIQQELQRQEELRIQQELQRQEEIRIQQELRMQQELKLNPRLQEEQLQEELKLESELPDEPNVVIEEPNCDIDFSSVKRVQRPNLNLSGIDEPFTQLPFVPGEDYYLVKVYIQQKKGNISTAVNYYDINAFQDWLRSSDVKCRHPEYRISLRLDNIKRFTYAPQQFGGKHSRMNTKLISKRNKKSKKNYIIS